MVALRGEVVKLDGLEEAPPVLPSPTNAQRQPMMPRSIRSVRTAVHGASWGPEVSNALATSLPGRPAPRSGGYRAKPVLEHVEDLSGVPTLETPTNSQRQLMMSRSNRSVRTRVAALDSAESVQTPGAMTLHAGATPKPVLDVRLEDLEAPMKLSGMATPTNLDRKNTQMSLQMGTPSFKGSAPRASSGS